TNLDRGPAVTKAQRPLEAESLLVHRPAAGRGRSRRRPPLPLAVDKRADIWAFGVVLFEMLTGRRLFTGETPSEILARVITEEPPWDRLPARCPAPIARLLRRCLRKRARERLQDIGDARLELSEVGAAVDGATHSPGREGAPKPARRVGTREGLGRIAGAVRGSGHA